MEPFIEMGTSIVLIDGSTKGCEVRLPWDYRSITCVGIRDASTLITWSLLLARKINSGRLFLSVQ